MNEIIHIFTDGGSIGNPGPSAIGVVIRSGAQVKTYAEKIDDATNNQAEYQAIIFALKKLRLLFGKKISQQEIVLHLDSELVGNQILGRYKIKEKELFPLFMQFWNLKIDFPNLKIKIIPREQNKEADKLVKSILSRKELF
jgi:ribonuclease HI